MPEGILKFTVKITILKKEIQFQKDNPKPDNQDLNYADSIKQSK